MKVSRRNFIKFSSLAGGGLLLHMMLPGNSNNLAKAFVFEPNLLVSISSDNTVTFTLTKQEMGQGVTTGMPMIFADELGADLLAMKVLRSDYNAQFEYALQGITGGSSSIQNTWLPLRQAAATTREMLIQVAMEAWKADRRECYAENSMVIHRPTGRRATFGSLSVKAAHQPIPDKVSLKEPADFKYIGRPVKNLCTKQIVTGGYNFGIDITVPGMLYTSIERAPVHLGKIRSYNDLHARQVEGVVDIVKIEGMVR